MTLSRGQTICYVVSYRDPDYVRTRTLSAALGRLEDCTIYFAVNRRRNWLRYAETLAKMLRIRIRHDPDTYILGFRGHEIFWFVRLIAFGRVLVFDEFMSPSDALTSEGKMGRIGRIAGFVLSPMEKACLRFSERCLTDTAAHRTFIADRFSVDSGKIGVVYVGAALDGTEPDRTAGDPVADPGADLNVLFYGTFLPLHGIEYILRACKLMKGKPVRFSIIGGKGRALSAFRSLCSSLGLDNVDHREWVDYPELKSTYIPRADVCLGGPFGGTPQAKRVITGKTFQFLAQSKATIIGAIDEPAGFVDRHNCLLVEQACPERLADALAWAVTNRSRLPAIGCNGLKLYQERFSAAPLARQLRAALELSP